MKTNHLLLFAGAILHTLTAAAQPQPPSPTRARYAEGEMLVKFAGGPRGVAAEQGRVRMNHQVKRNFDFIGWQQIRLPHGMTVEEGLTRYRSLPDVLAVEANTVVPAIQPAPAVPAFSPAGEPAALVPDDPLFPQQWALTKIGAAEAWANTTGSTNVIVAVLSTGVNYDHEDLRENIWRNPGEVPANGIDDDGNGYVDDVFGIDTADNDSDPMDAGLYYSCCGQIYHGTMNAGIIGAVGNNGLGAAGVGWSVQLMALRSLSATASFSASDAIAALDYVHLMKGRGANVRVVLLGYYDTTGALSSQAMREAHGRIAALGILQVAVAQPASVNHDVSPVWPSAFDPQGMIAVATSDQNDNLASWSGYGRISMDLVAPGIDIAALWGPSPDSYSTYSAGSDAPAAYVAGAAALLFAIAPAATADDAKAALLETVDVFPSLADKVVSSGRLNVGRAMTHPAIRSNSPPFIASQPQSRTTNEGANVSLVVTAYGTRPLFYQWQRQGEALAGRTNGSLTLSNLSAALAGDYTVVVSNAFGVATSAVATLTVRTPPRLVGPLPPLQLTAVPGETVTLSVETTGTLPIGFRWRHLRTNGTSVNLTTVVLHQNTCFLTLPVDVGSAGAYTIILTNAAQPTSSTQRTNAVITVLPDSDGDGLPDAWETTYPTAASGTEDTDVDGLTNIQEYQAGTDPTNALSYLRVDTIALAGESNLVSLRFLAVANRTYTVQHRNMVDGVAWNRLADVLAAPTNRVVEIIDTNGPAANPQGYYRLATPRSP